MTLHGFGPNRAGHLEISGCDALELAREFGTPLHVIDEGRVRTNCRAYRESLEREYGNARALFASKALCIVATCQIVSQEGLGLDVASGGEIHTALRAAVPPRDLYFHGNNKTVAVEPNKLKFESGDTDFDLLIAVPPHKVPAVVVDCGFAQPGKFIEVDRTCKTKFEKVYAIGDVNQIMVTDKITVPKAGIFAEGEGITVARNIISQIKSELENAIFDGKGGCFLETSKKTAGYLQVDMFASPAPITQLQTPSSDYFSEKEKFEKDRLEKWL